MSRQHEWVVCCVAVLLGIAGFAYSQTAPSLSQLRVRAEQGNANAQYQLGSRYANGVEVPKDYVQAYRWLNLAAAQGLMTAARSRDALAKEMTREQIAQAQALSTGPAQEAKSDHPVTPIAVLVAAPPGSKTVTTITRSTRANKAEAEADARTRALAEIESKCAALRGEVQIDVVPTLDDLLLPHQYTLADYGLDSSCDREGTRWLCVVQAKGYCVDQNAARRAAKAAEAQQEAQRDAAALSSRKEVHISGLEGIGQPRNLAEKLALQYAETDTRHACFQLPRIMIRVRGYSYLVSWQVSETKLDRMSCEQPYSLLKSWSCVAYVTGICEPMDKEGWLRRLPPLANPSPSSGVPPAQPSDDGSTETAAIARIRSGHHSSLPAPQEAARDDGTQASLTISNGTDYRLHVYIDGARNRTLTVPPHTEQSVALPPGQYEMGAEVTEASVQSFLGRLVIRPNTTYKETFVLGPLS